LIGKRPKRLEFIPRIKVRISSSKLTFDKVSQTETWTREIFTVHKAFQSYPSNDFTLKDDAGEEIIGTINTTYIHLYSTTYAHILLLITPISQEASIHLNFLLSRRKQEN
jgi:hypothetical protein